MRSHLFFNTSLETLRMLCRVVGSRRCMYSCALIKKPFTSVLCEHGQQRSKTEDISCPKTIVG